MKKGIITALMILTIITYSVIPFSVKAASNIVYATGGNITEGEYNVYTAQAASGSYLQLYAFDKYYSFDQYHSACIVKIDLNNIYSGDITLNFSSNYNTLFGLWWTETEQGSCGIDGLNKTFVLHLNEVQSLTLYLCSAQTSSNGIQPTSVSSNLAISSTYNNLLTFDIPLERTSAYSLLLNMGDQIHYDSSCPLPYIILDTNKSGQAWVYGGRTYLFAYAYDRSIGSKSFEQLFTVSYGNAYNTVANNQSVAPTVSGGFVYDWVEITFNTGYNGWFTLTPNYNCRIVPLYFNLNNNTISTELAEFLHHDPNNITYNQLQTIINALLAQGDPDVSPGLDDTTDQIVDLQNQENQIVSDFQDDLTDFNTQMDLSDYDFITGFQNSNNYFKMLLDNMYVNSSSIRAFWVVPVILVLFLAITGRK